MASVGSSKQVTIITAVLNGSRYINECLSSLSAQTSANYEHIIIDGGSSDGTLKVIDEYSTQRSHLVSETDKGLYDAMNKGIALASGEWILMLNSDDYLVDKDVLEKAGEILSRYPDAAVVYGKAIMKFENEGFSELYDSRLTKWNLLNGRPPPHMAAFVRKSAYQQYGLYDLRYKLVADYEFFVRLYIAGARCEFADLTVAVFRIHDDGRSLYRLHQFWKEVHEVMREHFGPLAWFYFAIKRVVMICTRAFLIHSGTFDAYRKLRKKARGI